MDKTSNFFLVFLTAGVLFSCGDNEKGTAIETEDIAFTKEGELFLIQEGDTIQKIDIEFAESDYERETGLMYRQSMEDDQGMLFIYSDEAPRNFHMKNTNIPLDIIFYSADSSLVSVQENAQPYDETSLPSGEPAKFILEVNAGKYDEWNLETGDKMDFIKLDQE